MYIYVRTINRQAPEGSANVPAVNSAAAEHIDIRMFTHAYLKGFATCRRPLKLDDSMTR